MRPRGAEGPPMISTANLLVHHPGRLNSASAEASTNRLGAAANNVSHGLVCRANFHVVEKPQNLSQTWIDVTHAADATGIWGPPRNVFGIQPCGYIPGDFRPPLPGSRNGTARRQPTPDGPSPDTPIERRHVWLDQFYGSPQDPTHPQGRGRRCLSLLQRLISRVSWCSAQPRIPEST